MAKKRLWQEKEIKDVELDYQNNEIFKVVKKTCLELSNSTCGMALSQIELFYHIIRSLDDLRGFANKEDRISYCDTLTAEISDYISCLGDFESYEVRNASQLIAHIVGQCLLTYRQMFFFDEIKVLFKHSGNIDPQIFRSLDEFVRNEKVKSWIKEYWDGNLFISDDIEDKLNEIRKDYADARHEQNNRLTNKENIDMCFFIHPQLDDDEAKEINQQIVRLVKRQGIQEICKYLTQLSEKEKVLLPQNSQRVYEELSRMGMPTGEGFNIKTFQKYYNK